MESLVSIITPSYNQATYLEDAIRSVLAQNDLAEEGLQVEYFVVDGASQDGSLEIIRDYADRLSWWVSEPDSGQAEAINKGLARAQGEYVAWLNSDDLYLPRAISQAVSVLNTNPNLGIVFGDAITIDDRGMPLKRLNLGDWGLLDLMKFRVICQPAVFMRRSFLEQAGLLDVNYHYMLDHHLWLRIASRAAIKHVPNVWAAARHHPLAKNVAHPTAFSLEILRILEWIKSQADLLPIFMKHERKIRGGAFRLHARYLLDGGVPGSALNSYLKALLLDPGYAIKHWPRILYAAISLIGINRLENRLAKYRYHHPPDLSKLLGVDNWPGLMIKV